MDAALNTWGGGVTGAGAKSPSPPAMVAEVVTATRRVAFTPALGKRRPGLGSETANRRRGRLAGDRRGGRHGSHALFARKVRRAAARRYGRAQNSGTGLRTTITRRRWPILFLRCRVGTRGELTIYRYCQFCQTRGPYKKNLTRRNSFICRVAFFSFAGYFGLTSSGRSKQQLEKQHAVANRRTRCQIKVFVGVWPVIRVGVASGGALEGARAHRRGARSRTQGVRHRGVVA